MTIFSGSGFYEMEFNNNTFKNLQFIRMDKICEILYVTMKNVVTGELFTVEINDIRWIREMKMTFDIVPNVESIA